MAHRPSDDLLHELIGVFAVEVEERLQSANRSLLELERTQDPGERERLLTVIVREVHTLKGAASSVGMLDVSGLAHGLEDLFGRVREGNREAGSFDLAYHVLDAIGALVRGAVGGTESDVDAEELLALLNRGAREKGGPLAPSKGTNGERKREPGAAPAPTGGTGDGERPEAEATAPGGRPAGVTQAVSVAPEETVRVATSKLDALMGQVGELLAGHIGSEQRLHEVAAIASSLDEWDDAWQRLQPALRKLRGAVASAARSSTEATPAVDTMSLLPFLEQSNQRFVALRSQVGELRRNLGADDRRMGQVTADLQEQVRRTRMLPVSAVFDALPRVVRDLSRDLGKKARLLVSGAETEVDRSVLDHIRAPLTHLIRNCLDHGLETAEARLAVGKDPEGTISVSAMQRGGLVLIDVADDGGGIDVEQVKSRAVADGLVASEEAVAMSDREAMRLIFRSGFSTSRMVTDVSGRGVGLDVVREAVAELRGQVEVESELWRGTRFLLSLPLTVTTTHCLLIQVGGQTYGLPIANVSRILRVDSSYIGSSAGREGISLDSKPVPLIRLRELLDTHVRPNPNLPAPGRDTVVVMDSAERRLAFVVDALIGAQDLVVKSLPPPLYRVRYTAGASILGTGEVVMILNVADLMRQSEGSPSRTPAANGAQASGTGPLSIMVVDDSIVTRMLEKSILEAAGYRVHVAIDGMEAWNELQGTPIDLVVLDVNMPRMDGFELTARLRASERFRDLPVVLVTSRDAPDDRRRGVDVGADAYIVKSAFSQDRLIDTIRRLT